MKDGPFIKRRLWLRHGQRRRLFPPILHNNEKLVHVTGFARTSKGTNALLERDLPGGVATKINKELKRIQNAADDESGASDSDGVRPAILLKRRVEYYEWIETFPSKIRENSRWWRGNYDHLLLQKRMDVKPRRQQ